MAITLGGQSGFWDTPIFNARIPKEGPREIPVQLPFTLANTSFLVDLQQAQDAGKISAIQSLFIDNWYNPSTVTISVQVGQQNIIFPAYSQGYIPVLAPSPARFVIESTGQVSATVVFLNVPVPAQIWGNDLPKGVYNSPPITLNPGSISNLELSSVGSLLTTVVDPATGQAFSTQFLTANNVVAPNFGMPISGVHSPLSTSLIGGNATGLRLDNRANLLITSDIAVPTFAICGVVSPVSGATDILQIIAPTSGVTFKLRDITISASCPTGGSCTLYASARNSLNTGGVFTSLTPTPFLDTDISSAVIYQYSANPTTLGTNYGNIIASNLIFQDNTTFLPPIHFHYGQNERAFNIAPTGALSISLAGATLPASTQIYYTISWVEV